MTTATTLRTVRGPVLSLPHVIQMRLHPVEHNRFLRATYGEVFRLRAFGIPMYVATGPDAAERVLVNRDRAFVNGPAWSYFIGPFFRRGIMLLDLEEHLHHRRILQQAFTPDALRRYHGVMAPHVREGLAGWAGVAHPRLHPMLKALTLDLALETFVGVDLDPDGQRRVNEAFIAAVRAGTSIVRAPVPGTPWARGLAARRVLEEFFRAHLPAKRAEATAAGEDGPPDLFAQLCRARSEDGHAFGDEDVVNHMIFLLMAAHDTTTTTLTSMAYHLARHPEWQERARAESLAAGELDHDGVQRLDLLDRVMKESLRLCSPVPTLPRMAVRDTEVGGYRIPAGAIVTVTPYVSHFLPEVWPDPLRFDPDRFAPDRREDRVHRLAFAPFGAGVHKCIGLHFAGLQVRTVFHELLRSYRWSVPPGYTWSIDLTALPVPRDGVPVTLERL